MKTKILTILLLAASVGWGAKIASLGTGVKGYWDDGAMWAGGVAPTAGDRGIISNADTLTVRYPFTGSFTMDSARTTRYNQLIINAKFTADATCTLKTFNTLDLSDTLDHAGNRIYYRTTSATASRYRIRYIGSFGDSAVVMSSGTWGGGLYPISNKDNSTTMFDLKYTKFTGVGSYVVSSTIAGQYINITNCLFDTCRFFTLQHSYLADSVKINNNAYKRRHDEGVADSLLWFNFRGVGVTSPAVNSRSIQYNVFDGGVNYKTATTSKVGIYGHNAVDFKIRHNVFISSTIGLSSLSIDTVDSNFFCNSISQAIIYKTPFRNNLFFATWNNPHDFPASFISDFSYNYIEHNYDAATDPRVTTARDGGDIFFCNVSVADSAILHHNVVLGSYGTDGCFFNFLGSAKAGNAKIYNNTIIRTVVDNYGIIRNENSGYGTTGIVKVFNNIFTSRNSGTGLVINFERPNEPNQIDSIDYNSVYNHGGSPFLNLEITGKTSGDPWFNDVVLNENPTFANDSFCLKWWTKKKGYDSTAQGVANAFIEHNDYIDSVLVAYKTAFAPTNSALDGTAFGDVDYGAVEFTAASVPTITSQPTAQEVDEGADVTFSLSASGTPTYQWYELTYGIISGATSSSYTFTTELSDNGNEYYCAVCSGTSCDTSDTVALTVNDIPDTIWGHNDTIYVDQTLSGTTTTYSAANRDNTGTDGTAYNSLHTALAATPKGTLILLRGGTYLCGGTRFTLPAAANGTAWTAGEYTEMKSYPGELAILDGENNLDDVPWASVLGSSQPRAYWKFERIEIRNGKEGPGGSARGFYCDYGPFIFKNCYIHDNKTNPSGDIPAGISGHAWSDCLVENCYFKENGSDSMIDHNAGHIIIFSDYREDSIEVHGFVDTGHYAARNTYRYNLVEGGTTGFRVTKGGQLFCGRNPDAGHGYDDTYKTYGDKIHHNIFTGTKTHAVVLHQDFVQVYNNIIYACTSGISMGTYERTRYKQSVYNNTVIRTPNTGLRAYHYKYTPSFNYEPMYYGYVYNNLLDSCTYIGANAGEQEEITLSTMVSWSEAKEDSFKISNCYSYRPAKRTYDLTGTSIIMQDAVRYNIANYQATINPSAVLYLQEYSAGNNLYVDSIKTLGTHVIDGSNTIANSGIGGNHPYLTGITIPSYIGATDPSADGWVDSVLALRDTFAEPEPVTITVQPQNMVFPFGAFTDTFVYMTSNAAHYNWNRNGEWLNTDNDTLLFEVHSGMDGWLVFGYAYTGNDTAWSDTITLTEANAPPVITVDPVSDTTTSTVRMFAEWTGDSVQVAWYRFHNSDTILMGRDSVLQFTATPAMHSDSIAAVLYNNAYTVMTAKAGVYFVYVVFDSVNTGDSNTIYVHGNFLSGSGWTATLSDSTLTTESGSATTQVFGYNHKITLSTARYELIITNGTYTVTLWIGRKKSTGNNKPRISIDIGL